LKERGPLIPEGISEPTELTITELKTEAFELLFEPPVFNASITNDGPDSVVRSIRDINRPFTINSGDTSLIEFNAPVLERIFFWVESSGNSAALRIDAIR
jgi:hypothetical protein